VVIRRPHIGAVLWSSWRGLLCIGASGRQGLAVKQAMQMECVSIKTSPQPVLAMGSEAGKLCRLAGLLSAGWTVLVATDAQPVHSRSFSEFILRGANGAGTLIE